MHIRASAKMLQAMSEPELEQIALDPARARNMERSDINLRRMTDAEIAALKQTFRRLQEEKVPRARSIVADIERWEKILKEGGSGNQRARNLLQFSDLVAEYIRTTPGHRIYRRAGDAGDGPWLAYYTNHVEYERENRTMSGHYQPASVSIQVMHWSLGKRRSAWIYFHNQDIDGRTVAEALAANGVLAETPELRDSYLEGKERFLKVYDRVGQQMTAVGWGQLLSGRAERTRMESDDAPGRVVIDVNSEPSERTSSDEREPNINPNFWSSRAPRSIQEGGSEELPANSEMLDAAEGTDQETQPYNPEIPIHPYIAVYHLNHHRRYRVRVSNLTDYQYDQELGDRLILPEETKRLIDTLVSQGRISFADIVEGKGAGACVLLGGPPGVGKTLSAEVYAERTERPLLSIQAAQLGVSPDQIESKLSEILARASRWNAVVLLDEADVYIRERGGNLTQNAIVASFLRVLERHSATIFMTTNRVREVDDAVVSRCIARIDYRMPTPEEQRAIWHVLNELNGTGLTAEDIDAVVKHQPALSGRDIKQTLKLASLWAQGHNEPISGETIRFVSSFIPTRPETSSAKE